MLINSTSSGFLIFLSLVATTNSAFAQSTAEKLRLINEQIVILSAEAKMLDAQLRVKDLEAKLKTNSQAANTTTAVKTNTTSIPEIRKTPPSFPPRISSIEGVKDNLTASISTLEGSKKVRSGDYFQGWFIREVKLDQVVFVKDGEVKQVSVTSGSATEQDGAARNAMPLPPLLPAMR
jgi:type IV pilus biogenesis protein PilP